MRRLPWCGRCNEHTRMLEDAETGAILRRCPTCHAGAVKTRHDPEAALKRRRTLIRYRTNTDDNCPACGERIYRTHRCKARGSAL